MKAGHESPPDDRQLACKAQAGCRKSFCELAQRHAEPLRRFLWRLTGSVHDAEDLAQESFLRAMENIGGYNPRYGFSTWLYTIARNMAVDMRRSRKTAREYDGPVAREVEAPDDIVAGRELRSRLWETARSLSSPFYEVLVLYYAEEKTVSDIAMITGRTGVGVRVTLHRARQALKNAVQSPATLKRANPLPGGPALFAQPVQE